MRDWLRSDNNLGSMWSWASERGFALEMCAIKTMIRFPWPNNGDHKARMAALSHEWGGENGILRRFTRINMTKAKHFLPFALRDWQTARNKH